MKKEIAVMEFRKDGTEVIDIYDSIDAAIDGVKHYTPEDLTDSAFVMIPGNSIPYDDVQDMEEDYYQWLDGDVVYTYIEDGVVVDRKEIE